MAIYQSQNGYLSITEWLLINHRMTIDQSHVIAIDRLTFFFFARAHQGPGQEGWWWWLWVDDDDDDDDNDDDYDDYELMM